MADRLDYYFRQRVTEAELDLGFSELEAADHNLAADLGFTGVLANAAVSPHAPVANLTVDVSGPGAILDQLGQRIFFSELQNVNVAHDDNSVSTDVSVAGKEKIVSVFVKFDRALSDPRIDGNSLTVFFRRDESFKFSVAQGAEAPAGTALPPPLRSDAILLADITRRFGQTQILAGDISIARRQDAFVIAGSPRSIRRGRTIEAITDLVTFFNALVNGTGDRLAASYVDYAGGGAWADGTPNPAATVQAELTKIIGDLAALAGAARVGSAGTAGAPNALGAGTVRSQLDALLGFINAHINQPAGAHAASAIVYGGGGAWKEGTTNPAATVDAELTKIIGDLAADAGAARIGTGARSNWLDGTANPTGVSVLAALSKIINDLSAADGAKRIGAAASGNLPAGSVRSQLDSLDATSVRTNVSNTFTQPQTFNGAAGDTSPAFETTSAPTARKLLWEFAINANYKGRLYSSKSFNGAFEFTINARWDGTQWVRDSANAGLFAEKWTFHNYEWRIDVKTASAASFLDSSWDGFFKIEFPFAAPSNVTVHSNGEVEGPGQCNSYIAAQAQQSGNGNLGGGAPWKKQFPSTPSSITFNTVSTLNVASGPFSFAASRFGTGAFVGAGGGTTTWFYTEVIAS